MTVTVHQGDCRDVLKGLPDASVHCIVTSPPYYGLRDYGVAAQMGLEATPDAFVTGMVEVFRECRRVLRDDGTLWLNMGDTYSTDGGPGWQGKNGQRSDRRFTGTRNTVAMREQSRTARDGYKPKDLMGIPWMLAFALRADGWYLRQDIIWSKPNPMPESVRDRCTKAHEYLFLLSKLERYYFDQGAIKEPLTRPEEIMRKTPAKFGGADKHVEAGKQSRLHSGNEYIGTDDGKRNKRSVWDIATQPFKEAHFATFPPALVEPCVLAGCPEGGTVLDPFGGAGTTGLVADRLQRNAILIELNPDYAAIARRRIAGDAPLLTEVA